MASQPADQPLTPLERIILEVEDATVALCVAGTDDLAELSRAVERRAEVLGRLVEAVLDAGFGDIPDATLDRLTAVLEGGEQTIGGLRQGRLALLEELRGLARERSCLPAAGEFVHLELLG